jgi:hypothetical protein
MKVPFGGAIAVKVGEKTKERISRNIIPVDSGKERVTAGPLSKRILDVQAERI